MQARKEKTIGSVSQVYSGNELVFMMGEELKKPLITIKALAESKGGSEIIRLEAKKALRSVDNLLMYQQLSTNQSHLQFEPVHVGSTLTHVAQELRPLSISHGCETEVYIQSGISPVDADRPALQSGLESMWQAVLGMTERPSTLSWHIYRSPQGGIRIALLNNSIDLSKVHLIRRGANPIGKSKQPFAGLSGPATDLVTAQGIFTTLGGSLRKIKKDGQQGLAVTLPASPQLSLV